MSQQPKIRGIAESALYTNDLDASRRFFTDILKLEPVLESDTLVAFDAGTAQVLLVFLRGPCRDDKPLPGGTIPGHQGDGPAHMAFHVSMHDYDAWKAAFAAQGIAILSEVDFAGGGRSLYFHDPAGNVLELATPGHWRNF